MQRRDSMKKENSLIKAGAVLVVSGFIVKLLSAFYRIPLTRMLGAAQMGRYSAVFSLFMPFFSFATAGIVPCISHFSAKLYSGKDETALVHLRRTAMKLYIAAAAAAAAAFVVFGYFYSKRQGEMLFFAGSIILAPNILFAVSENICKGITQGRMDMLPTAVANVIESVFKTCAGLAAVWYINSIVKPADKDTAVAAVLFTVTAAGFICCIYLLAALKITAVRPQGNIKAKGRKKRTPSVTASQLYRISFPIAVSALVISVANFFDTAVCLPRIDKIPYRQIVESFGGASFKNAQDMSMYLLGIYQGMVLTVFNLFPAVMSSAGSATLPVVSRLFSSGDMAAAQKQLEKVFSFTAAVSLPAMVYIFIFRCDILSFLFGMNGAQTQVAARLLAILLSSGVFCCFVSVFNSVLYAAGKSDTVFSILVKASAVRCIVNYVLCAVPGINIKAFAVSGSIFYTIIFILSAKSIKKLNINFSLTGIFLLPCAAAAVSGLSICIVTDRMLCWLPVFLRLFFSAVIFFLIYILILIAAGFRLISADENSKIYKE